MNRQQLCIRYGWRFSSPMPDRYINRESLMEEVDDAVASTDMSELQTKLKKQEYDFKMQEERLNDFEKKMELMFLAAQDKNPQFIVTEDKQVARKINLPKDKIAKLLKKTKMEGHPNADKIKGVLWDLDTPEELESALKVQKSRKI